MYLTKINCGVFIYSPLPYSSQFSAMHLSYSS